MHFSLGGLITNGSIRRLVYSEERRPVRAEPLKEGLGGVLLQEFFENIVNFVHSGAYLTRFFGQN